MGPGYSGPMSFTGYLPTQFPPNLLSAWEAKSCGMIFSASLIVKEIFLA